MRVFTRGRAAFGRQPPGRIAAWPEHATASARTQVRLLTGHHDATRESPRGLDPSDKCQFKRAARLTVPAFPLQLQLDFGEDGGRGRLVDQSTVPLTITRRRGARARRGLQPIYTRLDETRLADLLQHKEKKRQEKHLVHFTPGQTSTSWWLLLQPT